MWTLLNVESIDSMRLWGKIKEKLIFSDRIEKNLRKDQSLNLFIFIVILSFLHRDLCLMEEICMNILLQENQISVRFLFNKLRLAFFQPSPIVR